MLAAALILTGRLGDRLGRRRVLSWGLIIFGLASWGTGLVTDVPALIIGRAFQGLGMGLVLPQILATIQSTSTGEHRARSLARFAAVSGVSTVAGQISSGVLLSADLFGLSWRPVMFLSALLALVLLGLSRLIPATRSEVPLSLDLGGAVLLSIALAGFVVSTTLFSTGVAPWPAAALLLITATAAYLFYRWERHQEQKGRIPLTPPSLFRVPALRMGLIMNLLFFSGYGAFMYEFSALTQNGLHYGGPGSGLAIMLFALSFVITSAYLNHIRRYLGQHTMLVGASAQLVSLSLLALEAFTEGGQLQAWHIQPVMMMCGAAQAMMFGPLINAVMAQIPTWAAGLSGGLFGTVQQLSFSLGIAVLGGLYGTLSRLQEFGLFTAFAVCLLIQVGASAIFAVLSWRLHRLPQTAQQSTPSPVLS